MPYTMRKIPRSSFMGCCGMGADLSPPAGSSGDTPPIIGTISPTVTMQPVAIVSQMPPTAAPVVATTSSGIPSYVLWGGAALLAYWLMFHKGA